MAPPKKPKTSINPELEKAVAEMLKDSKGLPLLDRLAVIDRAMKLEALKMKLPDASIAGFFDEDGAPEGEAS